MGMHLKKYCFCAVDELGFGMARVIQILKAFGLFIEQVAFAGSSIVVSFFMVHMYFRQNEKT
jgi:hypothetical protein